MQISFKDGKGQYLFFINLKHITQISGIKNKSVNTVKNILRVYKNRTYNNSLTLSLVYLLPFLRLFSFRFLACTSPDIFRKKMYFALFTNNWARN